MFLIGAAFCPGDRCPRLTPDPLGPRRLSRGYTLRYRPLRWPTGRRCDPSSSPSASLAEVIHSPRSLVGNYRCSVLMLLIVSQKQYSHNAGFGMSAIEGTADLARPATDFRL
jgi:hypothetical protein